MHEELKKMEKMLNRFVFGRCSLKSMECCYVAVSDCILMGSPILITCQVFHPGNTEFRKKIIFIRSFFLLDCEMHLISEKNSTKHQPQQNAVLVICDSSFLGYILIIFLRGSRYFFLHICIFFF